MAAAQAAHVALNVASTIVLARLLLPSDFGLIAMVTAITSFLGLFRDLGLSTATVQRSDLTAGDLSALFWVNAILGALMAIAVGASAPLVAHFYGHPELEGVTLALACGFVTAGLSVQHSALLRRQLRFGATAVIDVGAHAVAAAAAILSAQLNAGYWALVVFQLSSSAAATTGAWIVCGWKPGWPPSFSGVRPLVSFGTGLTVFNTLAYLTRNLDNVILGRVAGAAALGFYTRAYSLLLMPVDRVRGPISAVVVPALARLQTDPQRFRAYFLKAITTVAAIGMPLVVFLFVFAEETVVLVLGAQWAQSVLLFRLLAPAAFVETFNTIGSWVCTPLGNASRLVRWQIVATIAMIAAFLVGAGWGAAGMAAAVSVATVALRAPATVYLLRGSPIRPQDLGLALCRPAIASIAAGGAVHAIALTAPALRFGSLLELVAAAALFAGLYLTLLFALPGGRRHLGDVAASLRALCTPVRAVSLPAHSTAASGVAQ
jgi:O-antigen/teichoic acid export membrane protein